MSSNGNCSSGVNEPNIGDLDIVKSLDVESLKELFRTISEEKPTLEEALEAINIPNKETVLKESKDLAAKAKEKPEIEVLGLTDDEAGAIACYTLDYKDLNIKSPYQILNEGIVVKRNKKNLIPISKLFYLLLSGLRKLPRSTPPPGEQLHRGISSRVPLNKAEANDHQYYEEGRIVTWWCFNSTTTILGVAKDFIGKDRGTIFNITGENMWGYDIKLFSQYEYEGEYLLEPETKFKVCSHTNLGNFLLVDIGFQQSDKLVLEDIIPISRKLELTNPKPESKKLINISSHTNVEDCAWKKFPEGGNGGRYSIDVNNPRIATKACEGWGVCTIVGSMPLPSNRVISWSIKVLHSRENDGSGIYIGVAPPDIKLDEFNNSSKCGWYFYCYNSTLQSGPPHKYNGKEYGSRKERDGLYIHEGDSVGVVMDTAKGKLSFFVNGVGYGVAYEGIPLDKPLVPCVILEGKKGDSIEIDLSEVEENVNNTIFVPSNTKAESFTWDSISFAWDAVANAEYYQIEVDGSKFWEISTTTTFTKMGSPDSEHSFRVRAVKGNGVSEWSDVMEGRIQKESFEYGWWKECPDNVEENKKYVVSKDNSRTATKTGHSQDTYCTIIGNTLIPLNKVTSWSIKILKSEKNDGSGIFVGVAPLDINQDDDDNSLKCGWYFYCYDSTLLSGPHHKYWNKEYRPIKEKGEYVHTGSSVGVVMDTIKGELSFVVNNVNYGVAYEGIPLDKPLVPCVLLCYENDSIEIDLSEVKENVNETIPTPTNIKAESLTWDSISFTWDTVEGAEFYQIEVDENKFWKITKANTFTKGGLISETRHNFKVRTVKDNGVSRWSDVMEGRIQQESFEYGWWKECPDSVEENKKYIVNKDNTRIATKTGYSQDTYCTIIGNTPIPLSRVISWSIKVIKSRDNDGYDILIGVAPLDINQNDHDKRGWYFYCYDSTLLFGPPHKYLRRVYGPRKENDGEYVHTGYSVGVMVDTIKGELSFVLNGVNYGVAYVGIPLDKPLVPCVLLCYEDDSIEIDLSDVRENVSETIPTPTNIKAESFTWNSVILTWDAVEGAEFYQIEVDESKFWEISTTNTFTEMGDPNSEHSFRVRTVKDDGVSRWSDVVKGRVQKESFEYGWWKECPDSVEENKKYIVNKDNTRIATKTGYSQDTYCTIIGNTPIPLNKVISWSITILKSNNDDGENICIGIAPLDINQNDHDKCGWYFYCYDSTLLFGPPHKYLNKVYGPRKRYGEYIHTGDVVGVVMDTINGDLSFVLNGVNYGVAYVGIPLDKPLVPCVLLCYEDDSIEIDLSDVRENVSETIPTPTNIKAESYTWNSVILTWDAVEGAEFYQIEVDENKFWKITKANTFTKVGLTPESEHSFRVRTVKDDGVSEWSDAVNGRVLKECVEWKECPDNIEENKKYSVDANNPTIATLVSNEHKYCTIVGTPSLPHNKETFWGIEIRKSNNNDGSGIFIGVAPYDINQNNKENYQEYGWYINCYSSTLYSGPPHNYKGKEYGPRKEKGQYVYTGSTVGVVMDTTKGELSFDLNGVNLGVAYDGIPLDKPLVPCVILYFERDSVKFILNWGRPGGCVIS